MRLHKPPHSAYWHADVLTEDGSVRTFNTFCATRAEAHQATAKARQIEAAARQHRLTADVVTLITANRRITVDQAIAEWVEWAKVGVRSARTRSNTVLTQRQWAREMALGTKSIGTVTTDDIHGWLNRPDDPTKRGTRLLKLSAVRALFRFCLVKRYVLADPSQLVSVDHRLMSRPTPPPWPTRGRAWRRSPSGWATAAKRRRGCMCGRPRVLDECRRNPNRPR